MSYVVLDDSGFVNCVIEGVSAEDLGHLRVVEAPDGTRLPAHAYYDGSRFKTLPDRPGPEFTLDKSRKQWVFDPNVATMYYRRLRDTKLAETDWTQSPDVPEATKAKWQAYRQALRDLPQQPGFPENITWPEPPK